MISKTNYLLASISSLSLIACAQGEFSSMTFDNGTSQQLGETSLPSTYAGSSTSYTDSPSSSDSSVYTPPSSSSSSGSSGSSYSSGSSKSGGSHGSSTKSSSSSAVSSGSSSTSSSSNQIATSSMPTKSCVNSSSGGLDFRLDTDSKARTHVLRLIAFPSTLKGSVEAVVVYEGPSGLRFDRDPSEPFVNKVYDDNFWQCGTSYSTLESMAKKQGYSTLNAAIPNVEIRLMQLREPQSGERLAGIALKQSDKVWALQCF